MSGQARRRGPSAEGPGGRRDRQPTGVRGADRRRPCRGRRRDRPRAGRPRRSRSRGDPGRRPADRPAGPQRPPRVQQAGGCAQRDVRPERSADLGDYVQDRKERLFHVGRLDAETEGLILLTNDGELAHRLAHPRYEVPKTYLAEIAGPVPRDLGRRLREGVELDDGPATVDAFRVVSSAGTRAMVELVLHEGRNRIVRRMLGAEGFPVAAAGPGPARTGQPRRPAARPAAPALPPGAGRAVRRRRPLGTQRFIDDIDSHCDPGLPTSRLIDSLDLRPDCTSERELCR